MFARRCVPGLSLLCLALSLAGCSAPSGLDSVQVSPATQSLTVGQTANFTAVGTYGNAKHLTTQDITGGVNWASSSPSVATISSSGVATAVSAGSTTITGSATSFNGHVASSAVLTVTGSSGGSSGGVVSSITIIPGTQAVASPTQTSQFIAIGVTASGATVNLTNQATWTSSSAQIATIGATTGLATAVGKGTATITAIYANTTGGTVATGTASFSVTGGTTQQFTAVSITPGSQALSASGQTGQFIALGTSGTTGLTSDVTNSPQITWSSSIPSVATVSAAGLATGLSVGTTTVTAKLTNSDGSVVSNTATLAVSLTAAPEPLLSLTIIPDTITVGNLQDTGQFFAYGTFSTVPYVRDLTNSVTWLSSFQDVFPVDTNTGAAGGIGTFGGLVTAYGSGSATIIAEATSTDGTIQTATATFNCPLALPNPNGDPPTPGTCIPGTQAPALKATITVIPEGLNSTPNGNWLVTAPSASGTPDVIHCGPGWTGTGGSVCSAPYTIDPTGNTVTTVVITAPAQAGVAFGGWSYNCTPNPVVPDPVGPNTCTITLSSSNPNVSVLPIFN